MKKTVVIDNGAGFIRGGFAGECHPSRSMPNCTAKFKNQSNVFVGDDINEVSREKSQLIYQRPHDRGYLVNWEIEYEIWRRMFDENHLNVATPSNHALLFTEPPFAPTMLSEITSEIIFEEFGFNECYRCPAPALSAYYEQVLEDEREEKLKFCNNSTKTHPNADIDMPEKYSTDAMVVVDSGFSFTHVFCFYKGRAIQQATVRLNVGGKLLTNYLKEILSFRQWNVMDEFELVTQAKEALCFISSDFKHDMLSTRNSKKSNLCPIVREFVLPDYKRILKGYARDPSKVDKVHNEMVSKGEEPPQFLKLESERFAVPELLFNPSDIGIMQAGLPECIMQSIQKCPSYLQLALSGNVLLTGGCTNIPGYENRLYDELRKLLPTNVPLYVHTPKEPELHAWKGGSHFASSHDFSAFAVTKHEYEDEGHRICAQKFMDW